MRLHEILSVKGTAVHSIPPDATLQDVVRTLIEHRIGALIVLGPPADGKDVLLGIISERDILRACMIGNRPLGEVRVAEVMTTALVTGTPDDEVESVMGLMTSRRIRHLPVLVEGCLAGIISIGDVVKAQHDRLIMENQFMQDYIGRPR
jgi:CBS domain-containing protein